MYKGRQVTVTEHILGGYRRGAKHNSPYTSFSNLALNWTKRDTEYLIRGEIPSKYFRDNKQKKWR